MADCIFCKIIKEEIPCAKVYENDEVLAFLDISPVNKGHVLVLPKKHFENIENLPDEILCEIARTIKKLSKAALKAVGADSFNLGLNNGKNAGQLVQHVHFHIMPRFENDGYKLWIGKKYTEGEMKKIAKSIKKNL